MLIEVVGGAVNVAVSGLDGGGNGIADLADLGLPGSVNTPNPSYKIAHFLLANPMASWKRMWRSRERYNEIPVGKMNTNPRPMTGMVWPVASVTVGTDMC